MTETQQPPLKPFDMVKAIVLDDRFTHAEARFLTNHVFHTDNASRKVRHSISATAAELGIDRKVGTNAITKAEQLGYLVCARNRRDARGWMVKDVWFRSVPPVYERPDDAQEKSHAEKAPAIMGHSKVRETPTSTPSTTSTPLVALALKAPCFCSEAETCKDCAPPAPTSSLPDWKQRQLYERELETEGLSPYGEALEASSSSGAQGYRRRSRG